MDFHIDHGVELRTRCTAARTKAQALSDTGPSHPLLSATRKDKRERDRHAIGRTGGSFTSSMDTDTEADLHMTGDPLSHTVRLNTNGPALTSKLNTVEDTSRAQPAGAPENRPNEEVPDSENLNTQARSEARAQRYTACPEV